MPAAILIVDDEPSIALALSMILSDEGYSVRTASNGIEAGLLLKMDRVDLIVSDVMMPGIDGVTMVRLLRSSGDLTPVVLMSAAPGGFVNFPFVKHVAKPFDIDFLLKIVEESLEQRPI